MNFLKKTGELFNADFLSSINLSEGNPEIDRDTFSELMINNFFRTLSQDTIDNITGLDKSISNGLYGNSAIVDNYKGIIDIMIKHYINSSKASYEVSLINNTAILKSAENFKTRDLFKHRDDTYNNCFNIVVIDFSQCREASLLKSVYRTIYNVLLHAEGASKLSGSPIVKISGLRKFDKSQALFIKNQLKSLGNALRKNNGIGYMDALDSLEIVTPHSDYYSELFKMLLSTLCHITRLPISYISGSAPGGLNTTGEGDKQQLERALRGYFNEYFKPVLVQVSSILGYSNNIKMKTSLFNKFREFAPFLKALEESSLLSNNQKKEIVNEVLNYQ